MKLTRSALAVITALMLLCSALPSAAGAPEGGAVRANEGPLVITAASVTGSYGQVVEVPITVSSPNEFEAHTIRFVAQYNKLAFRLVGVSYGELLQGLDGANITVDTMSYPGNVYVCVLCTGGGISSGGTLLTLRFRVSTEELTPARISLFHGEASYFPIGGSAQDIPTQLVDGTVTLVEPPLYPYGDANLDGELSFADISAMYAIIVGSEDATAQQTDIADFNRDGVLSFGDMSALYNHLIQSA